MTLLQSFLRNQNGTSPVEFAVIATIIAFALISVLTTAGTTLDATTPASVHRRG